MSKIMKILQLSLLFKITDVKYKQNEIITLSYFVSLTHAELTHAHTSEYKNPTKYKNFLQHVATFHKKLRR